MLLRRIAIATVEIRTALASGEQRAVSQRAGAGIGDQQDADKPDDQRRPAVDADLLLQDHDRKQGREQWRREAERRRRAERQNADREEPAQHRAELRQPALQMLTVASRPPDAPSGARQYDRRDGDECEQGAPESDLAE